MTAVHRVDYAGEGLSEAELAPTPVAAGPALGRRGASARAERGDDVPEPRRPLGRDGRRRRAPERAHRPHAVLRRARPRLRHRPRLHQGPGDRRHQAASRRRWSGRRCSARSGSAGWRRRSARDEVARATWASRPWGSRISAWASRPVAADRDRARAARGGLRRGMRRSSPTTGGRTTSPSPTFWGGYRVRCDEVEFWAGRRNRLHDRLVFTAVGAGGGAAAQDVAAYPSLDDRRGLDGPAAPAVERATARGLPDSTPRRD